MKNRPFFPAVEVREESDHVQGRIGFKVESIINGQLLADAVQVPNAKVRHPLDPVQLQGKREALLQALAAWADEGVFELHYKASPNILYQTRGRLEITLTLTSCAGSEEEVKEGLIISYLSLHPLLRSHLQEITFCPIQELQELQERTGLAQSPGVVCIHRRKEAINVDQPSERLSVQGFGHANRSREKTKSGWSLVEHTFPFVPAQDDWSILLKTLMNQLDPVHVLIRLKPVGEGARDAGRLEQTIQQCEQIMNAHQDGLPAYHQAKELRSAVIKQQAEQAGAAFRVGVFVLKGSGADRGLAGVLGRSMTVGGYLEEEKDMYQGGFACTSLDQEPVQDAGYFYEQGFFSVREAACAFRLPSPPLEDIPGLPVQRARTCLAHLPETTPESNSLRLLVNSHQGITQPVHQSVDDRMKHTFVLGQTGTGKSTLLESIPPSSTASSRTRP
ncbi:MAG: hypothetical protein K9K79_03760 [Desulfohalobiaceae bacterium]|nr:hypothetical protein [Desulfohalobiaceae bacterium]